MPPRKQPAKKVAAKKTAKRVPVKKTAKKVAAKRQPAKREAPRKRVSKKLPYKIGWDENGKCKLCRQMRTDKGHDPCIADLPGVLYACCGHGQENGYIKFLDGRCINFKLLTVDLEFPNHYLAQGRLVPLWVDGQSHKVLNMETGRKKVERSHGTPISNRFEKLVMDPIEGNIDDQET